jgi:hypothetical protein
MPELSTDFAANLTTARKTTAIQTTGKGLVRPEK